MKQGKKILLALAVCGGLLLNPCLQRPALAKEPFKLDFGNTTVVVLSAVTLVGVVVTAFLFHESVQKKREARERKKREEKGEKMIPKTKEEMKRELIEMRKQDEE